MVQADGTADHNFAAVCRQARLTSTKTSASGYSQYIHSKLRSSKLAGRQ